MELEEILPVKEPDTSRNNRLVESFTKIVHYMGNLSHEQLDALRINVKTVHWLQQRVEFDKIQYQEDPVPGSIFKVFSKNKEDLMKARRRQLIVIIKPTDGANYKNFVDIMDELNIAGIKTAPAIDDVYILDSEKDAMKAAGIL